MTNTNLAQNTEFEIIDGLNLHLYPHDTYSRTVQILQERCKQENNIVHPQYEKPDGNRIYRPLTFKENIEARVNDYNTLRNADGSRRSEEQRLRLFEAYLNSCTGIAYKKGNTKLKFIPLCKELITIPPEYNDLYYPLVNPRDEESNNIPEFRNHWDDPYHPASLHTEYSSLEGIEFDDPSYHPHTHSSSFLSSDQKAFLSDQLWRAAVEDDDTLWKAYTEIVFPQIAVSPYLYPWARLEKKIGFSIKQNYQSRDRLISLRLGNSTNIFRADGCNGLEHAGAFIRVIPRHVTK